MYHFHNEQLRVVQELCVANSDLLKSSRLIILEHILPTTEEFVTHLHAAGAAIHTIFSKPYSIDRDVLSRMEKLFNIKHHNYDELEKEGILDECLSEAIAASELDGKRIIIIDVGGYFCEPIKRLTQTDLIAGIVEDTTFGHNRYFSSISNLKFPVFSVARSALKEIEARFVGRDAVIAMDMLLRNAGISLSGRRALVLGYGMIGKNVARSLKAHDLPVSVYDRYDIKNIHAFIDGYRIHKKRELLKESDIIFSATANMALSYDEIRECKSNVILASVGSKSTEFDVANVIRHAKKTEKIQDNLIKYELTNSKFVIVAKGGAAVNFLLPSTPKEVLDLVFSEIIQCCLLLLNGKSKINSINTISDEELSYISKQWLIPMNQQ